MDMAKNLCITLLAGLLLVVVTMNSARAELTIRITQGVGKQTPIAIVPFGFSGDSQEAPTDVASIIAADLQRSGRFAPTPRDRMLQTPTSGVEVDFDDWSLRHW